MRNFTLFLVLGAMVTACAVETTRRKGKNNDDDDDAFDATTGVATTGADAGTGTGAGAGTGTGGAPGTTTTTTTSTTIVTTTATTSGGGCLSDPDCPNCFCEQDPTGCDAYIQVVLDTIYCGQQCGATCSTFCSTMDPTQIDFTCDNCALGNMNQADIDAFSNQCSASSACVSFANQIATCP